MALPHGPIGRDGLRQSPPPERSPRGTADRAPSVDPMEGQPIRCELEMDAFGLIKLTRGPGCTLMDALDLCVLMVSGGYRVLDVTPISPDQRPAASTDG